MLTHNLLASTRRMAPSVKTGAKVMRLQAVSFIRMVPSIAPLPFPSNSNLPTPICFSRTHLCCSAKVHANAALTFPQNLRHVPPSYIFRKIYTGLKSCIPYTHPFRPKHLPASSFSTNMRCSADASAHTALALQLHIPTHSRSLTSSHIVD